ncbi:phenylalanine--tRNA ligase subunit beta [Leifsonia sp. ZF2019]|uniref:phenylalanine--tRNA ligase subunit beta n=1 Tax=Leifsonia sp. ZF2019 TaxID=2781978 RepID=UPI001CBB8A0C|nr:phenylalanine--tRNA ligase subunit beta [Leifsonia sp. ZF2019]UAJ80644.1 phenylalanine--tRNA ligase subunit beta [Leifsonia sp. ZF2019]
MRVPLSWLGEYVDLEPGTTADEVHAALVAVGLEEEDVHTFEISGPVVVGEVLDFVEEPQSNGKTIRWCQVRVAPEGRSAADGGEDVRGIVCGASNFLRGDKVVVTLPGSVLPGPFPIAARKTYGHVSDGMIASTRELGLGDDHAGILRLVTLGLDPEVGTDAISLLGLDDTAVEVNVTPDRGYAFSIRGIAREYSHATGAAFRDPADAVAVAPAGAHAHGFSVAIDDRAPIRGRIGSSVFVTRVVRDVDGSRPTPPWMVSRLTLAGIRSISLIVDITNYVMLELGQPIHAYDLDRIAGGLVVRRAHPGETLVTLDEQARALHVEDLLITDDSGAIGLAGVMGGASTEIGEGTTNVLIEAANFDPVSIARTARRHKLPSEASKRFERGVDPRVAVAAAARVVQLLEQLAGGHADELGSLYDEAADAQAITLPDGYIASLIGVDFTDDEVRGALAEIGGSVSEGAGALLVVPPSWRPDLLDKSDLAEEVARIVGYDRIPSVLPVAPPGRGLSREQKLRRAVAQTLADNGSTEVLAFPFVSAAQNDLFGAPEAGGVRAVKLANALDATAPFLRTSLLPGLIDVAKRNIARGLVDLSVYEIGTVFLPGDAPLGSASLPVGAALPDEGTLAALNAGIPAQPRHLAGLVVGNRVEKQPGQDAVAAGLADALAMVRQAAVAAGVEVRVEQARHQALHPGRTARVVARAGDGTETAVGYAGELLPALSAELDLPRVVAVFELDLDALIAVAPADVVARVIAGFPAATQDLSLVVPAEVPAAEVLAAVQTGAGALLEDIRLVDDYRGAGLPEGAKSLTFALRFRAEDRTLTAAEASEAKLAGAALAAERFGATVRE